MTHANTTRTTRQPTRRERIAAAVWSRAAEDQETNRAEAESIVLRLTDRSVEAAEGELRLLRRQHGSNKGMKLALAGAFSSAAEMCEGSMRRFMERASEQILQA